MFFPWSGVKKLVWLVFFLSFWSWGAEIAPLSNEGCSLGCSTPKRELQEASLSVYWDQVYLSELIALISDEGSVVRLHWRDVELLFREKISANNLEQLFGWQDEGGWIDLEHFSTYHPRFDLDGVTLAFQTPPAERTKQSVSLRSSFSPFPEGCLEPAKSSAYLNLRHSSRWIQREYTALFDLDGAWRLRGWVAEGRASFQSQREHFFDYRDVRLVYDQPQSMTRWVVGEEQSFSPRLLRSDRIHGVKYSTEFRLNPSFVTDPISEYSFLLENDSLVEIWVNGSEIDVLRLAAGPYDIRDFPLTNGYNEVLLKIRDDLGRLETLTFHAVTGPNLLPLGCKEFAYSLGLRGSGREWEDKGIASLFYRRALTSVFTGSYEARFDETHQGMGVGGDFALSQLYGSVDVAVSRSEGTKGWATRATVGKSWGPIHSSARYDYQSWGFLHQNQLLSVPRLRSSLSLALSAYLGEEWGNVDCHYVHQKKWNGEETERFEWLWEMHLGSNWRLHSAYTYGLSGEGTSDFRIQLHYNGLQESVVHNHVLTARREGATLRSTLGSRSAQRGAANWKMTHYAQKSRGHGSSHSLHFLGERDFRHFSTSASSWVDSLGEGAEVSHHLNVASSVALCEGQLAIGRPIQEAFAVVSCSPALESLNLEVHPSFSQREKIGGSLATLLPSMKPFYCETVFVGSQDPCLPFEERVFSLCPAYKSGHHLRVEEWIREGKGEVEAEGILCDESGEVLALQPFTVGRMSDGQEGKRYSFTNGEGRFELGSVALGEVYELDILGTEPLHYQVAIPEKAALGERLSLGKILP